MPVVADFGGFQIRIYGGDHNPPHVHVVDPDREAKVAIRTRELLIGVMLKRVAKVALPWIEENEAFLMAEWKRLNQPP